MKYKFNINPKIWIATLTVVFAVQFSAIAQKEKVEKKISEKYNVSKTDKLLIDNRYGEVVINTWNQNKITVDIHIEAWGKNEDKAREELERIEIDYGKSGNVISFVTKVANKKGNWGWGNDKSGFEINYTVNMPKKNPLDLSNKYGSIHLADFDGDLKLSLGYGRIEAGNIADKTADISVKYSKASFKDIGGGELYFRYSGGITIGRVGDIELSDQYGGVRIEAANSIDADIAYSSLKLGELTESLKLRARYSGSSVEKVKAGFKYIDIDTSYGSSTLGFDRNANFDFDISARYGGFKNRLENVDMHKSIKRNTSSEYEGTHGSGGKGKVTAEASYGSIVFE